MFNYSSIVNIPAYDASNHGLIVEFKLSVISNSDFLIQTKGKVAAALKKNLNRVIEIMSSMKQPWKSLESMGYLLECSNNEFIVKDSKSSSLGLAIALINLNRTMHGYPQVLGLSGTGMLRIDGSFDHSNLELEKYSATKQNFKSLNTFITANESKNLFELEQLINQL